MIQATFVIVGGGIAGVSCAETLALLEPNERILLISDSALIKTAVNLQAITKLLTNFQVQESPSSYLTSKFSNIHVIHDHLTEIDDVKQEAITQTARIQYKFLCLCLGAKPKLIEQGKVFPQVLGIRDTDSVDKFVAGVSNSRTIVVLGNGGIASEIVYKVTNVNIHWIVKDKHISATFVDPGAAEFFQTPLNQPKTEENISKRMRYTQADFAKSGAALGPDWYSNLIISGSNSARTVQVHYEAEITDIETLHDSTYPIQVVLTTGDKIPCDLVISATGVTPRSGDISIKTPFELSEDGGIKINEFMQTSVKNIYAAGDICQANWPLAKHWFQMKLWTQARQMGCYAAKCLSAHARNESVLQDFCFEMFAHTTKLFGYKVILLGLYNGQKLDNDYEILLRMTKNEEYIKFILQNGKLQGVVLIGNTDLEEMCENLILNQLDLTPYGEDILNPNIDIEDYFD